MLYRRALIVLALALAPLVASASASASTVSPSGAYAFTASASTVWALTSNGQRLNCTSATFFATIDGSGAEPPPPAARDSPVASTPSSARSRSRRKVLGPSTSR